MPYLVPAVDAAGRILEYLARQDHNRVTLSDIADAVQLNKGSCLRILRTLREHSLVHYDETTKRYFLGSYLFVLGARAAEQIDVVTLLLPVLREAAEETGVTCVAVQRAGKNEALYIAKEEPPKMMRISVGIGHRLPLIAGSHGRCFLAYMPEDEARSLLKSHGLVKYTPQTETSVQKYLAALRLVKKRGFAVSRDEYMIGISGVSAPVFDGADHVTLVLAGIGTTPYIGEVNVTRVGMKLRSYADRVSRQIRGAESVTR